MGYMDLSGSWRFETDEKDRGIQERYYERPLKQEGFCLPGSACQNHVGKKQEYYSEFSKEAVRAPRERYEYIGPLWLEREVEVPQEAEGKAIFLFLERVNVASELWLDGKQVGRQILELSAPHCYDLTGVVTAGKHRLTLRLDNRNLLNLGDMASGYSIDTQGYWNGAIGALRLEWREICHVGTVQIYPETNGIRVHVTVKSDSSYMNRQQARLTLTVTDPDGQKLQSRTYETTLFNSGQVEHLFYGMDAIRWWDEFHPDLYRLTVSIDAHSTETSAGKAHSLERTSTGEVWKQTDERTVTFGMRRIAREGRKFLLNGKQISLRGTTDCAIHPITGYPPMDLETWRNKMRIVKEYGMNHVRFHAWCPPECAFQAADEAGVYLSVEMPFWLNKDVCPLEAGDDPIHRPYFTQEAITISKTYGNHPSFLLFSNGNEIMGDFELLEDLTTMMKGMDPRRLYTLTSNFDHPVAPCEDYFCAFEAAGHRTRIQTLQDEAAEHTCLDYREAVEAIPVPVMSFEVGQYCLYPDVDAIQRYTGNMLPVNLDVIRKSMKENGIYGKRTWYQEASGKLAVKLYKEDMECALRTKDFGGIGLLALTDYTGQSTATVGLLDAFWENKGIITPEAFRRFCGPVVPLWKARRVYLREETIEAELDLYQFGETPVENPLFCLKVMNKDTVFYEIQTRERHVSIPLSSLKESVMLQVILTVEGYTNDWTVFVYAGCDGGETIPMLRGDSQELKDLMEQGGRAMVGPEGLRRPMEGSFTPVFWSPVHFPTSQPCGAMIRADHAALKGFPTDRFLDFQWKHLMDHCQAADVGAFPESFRPVVELVPNFVDNRPSSPLFAVKAGKAEILFCGFDLEQEDPATRQLKACLARYLQSGDFTAEQEVEPEVFLGLFQ